MIEQLDIHALVDGELDASKEDELRRAIDSDPKLRAEYDSIVAVKKVLQTKAVRVESPEGWKSCTRRLAEIDKSRKVESFVGRYAWGLCGLFLAALIGGAWFNRTVGSQMVRTGEVAQMMSGLVPMSAPVSNDPETQRRWAVGALGGAPMNLQPNVIRVVGGAYGEVKGRKVVRLNLRDAYGNLALVAISNTQQIEGVEPMASEADFQCGKFEEVNCVAWTDNGYAIFVIGNRPYEQLRAVAQATKVR